MMALSIKYEHLLSKRLVDSHGELAGLAGADRSVISRIIRLRLLAPDIQEWLINLPEQNPGGDPVGWTEIRPLTGIVSWEEQRRKLKRLIASKHSATRCGVVTNRIAALASDKSAHITF